MDSIGSVGATDDWDVVLAFLPEGWEQKAKELGALRRRRQFADPGVLLRTLLIHLADGCSLRETAAVAETAGLASVSAFAVSKRLHASGEWLRWLCSELMRTWVSRQPEGMFDGELQVRVIDGSMIKEPGPTGSCWRLHYAISLPDLRCEQAYVTDARVGESFQHFQVAPDELLIGDRLYGTAPDIAHVLGAGGQVLVRINHTNLALQTPDGDEFDLFAHLRTLSGTRLGDWPVRICHAKETFCGRLCAAKKSAVCARRARQRAKRKAQKAGYRPSPQTLEAAGYIMAFTTLPRKPYGPKRILELYRGRWQIELVFKRMKSIMGLGHLPKTSERGISAWIHGKLFVALLIEAMIVAGEAFFPWGYPLRPGPRQEQVPVA